MARPLEHITILDLSRVLACPFASMILAELGANVIKVEQPGTGDETRSFEPRVAGKDAGHRGSESAYYMAFNRSKQSITVNLRSEQGQQIVRDLAAGVDVVIENFPVGTLKRYGLDADRLREINPKLVYLSCTGFGQTGPYASRKGYDTVFQAMGGIMSLTGEREGGPVKPGLPVADLTSGLWAAIALLSALEGRSATGQGCHIDLSMFDAQVSLLTLAAARWFALNEVPPRLGTEHPGRVPSASFQAQGGRWLHVTASDQHWTPLCGVLGIEAWGADPALQTNAGRVAHRDEVMRHLTKAIASWDRDALCDAMDAAGVPAGPINAVDEVLTDPHVQARGMVAHFDHPEIGTFPALPVPLRFDGWDDPLVGRPPLLGEHTETVLRERLGMDAERVLALREAKAI
ncbi:CaiB/BaiF CoA transferase family protein [Cupriavidus plantarum]|uniref:Crotonobetainyl-CoA:carnitine CoA-transferase CaiB-like acyl-CoA transferase n=1 Tax=Cupriavidus plantarum TaxID=942865 RepID=A0A316EU98_9BURK|nr:CaiB/BaiF CoA-transferase family protein [Cupriavidus plantarum]NYI00275.1 crotonobetainyl-CoA:carnitine CoA-transferase CaiB-like acyl-CoA transferase [Cupriavidus plantarum]PWK34327.1 crotonobetainyl-CoA:carnitine CoA-transferase CaiB-like acyl-CoA transferase [Cupriavidus plantarum]REE89160.1 crotonobetainyl-CoA:carnitine CoA-transferase CaiB-like acyl-CoA transferase [Cupriavidus plantarum]CAG2138575.1 Acetyl-CoA:oxalate CoA-transferase [Cupriavidus plantarum]SMR85853.1 Crotonobetainyl-